MIDIDSITMEEIDESIRVIAEVIEHMEKDHAIYCPERLSLPLTVLLHLLAIKKQKEA